MGQLIVNECVGGFAASGSAGYPTEYYPGKGGADVLTSRTSTITPERWQEIEGLYQKLGGRGVSGDGERRTYERPKNLMYRENLGIIYAGSATV